MKTEDVELGMLVQVRRGFREAYLRDRYREATLGEP